MLRVGRNYYGYTPISSSVAVSMTDKAKELSFRAQCFMEALDEVFKTKEAYILAEKNVPDYTGHLTSEDYYRDEWNAYADAAERLCGQIEMIAKETENDR